MKILVWFYDNELAGEEDERKCIEGERESITFTTLKSD